MAGSTTDFARLVSKFLGDYLPLQRGCTRNTVLSYRDAMRLLCTYVTESGTPLASFGMGALDRELVIGFLSWLRARGCSPSTTNQRLAAVRSFASWCQLERVDLMEQMQGVMSVGPSRGEGREVSFLTADQTRALINRPDPNTAVGLRHRAALTLLYDAGCRVSELCGMDVGDLCVGPPATARLRGKGRKVRTVPVDDRAAKIVGEYLGRQRPGATATDPLVTNRVGARMTREGMRYVVSKYAGMCRAEDPSFPSRVHPHVLRHSKAMHMLEAGVNIVYIRDFLGHEDVSTTMVYVRADMRLKDEAVNKLVPKLAGTADLPDWRSDGDLMAFLDSFR